MGAFLIANVVKEKGLVNKSMLASKNLPKPVLKFVDGFHWLKMLSAELAHRLIKAREETPGLWPKTLAVRVSEGDRVLCLKIFHMLTAYL